MEAPPHHSVIGPVPGRVASKGLSTHRPPAAGARPPPVRAATACDRRVVADLSRFGVVGWVVLFFGGGVLFRVSHWLLVGRSQTFAGVVGGVQAFLTDDVV